MTTAIHYRYEATNPDHTQDLDSSNDMDLMPTAIEFSLTAYLQSQVAQARNFLSLVNTGKLAGQHGYIDSVSIVTPLIKVEFEDETFECPATLIVYAGHEDLTLLYINKHSKTHYTLNIHDGMEVSEPTHKAA